MYSDYISSFRYLDREYEIWKRIQIIPMQISYAIFDDQDTRVFHCDMTFYGTEGYKDAEYQKFYTEIDQTMAKGMEQQYKQIALCLANDKQLKDIKRQNKLARFDAMIEKRKKNQK